MFPHLKHLHRKLLLIGQLGEQAVRVSFMHRILGLMLKQDGTSIRRVMLFAEATVIPPVVNPEVSSARS
jgi:hypothetical protein